MSDNLIFVSLLHVTSACSDPSFYSAWVGKYHDIFENIKISKISKISWYFWYFRYFPENENFE